MSETPNSWQGLLAEGETILWQGRPTPGIHWRDLIGFQSAFGLFFFGFSLVWVTMALVMTQGGDDAMAAVFPLFGLPFVLVGFYLVVGHLFWDVYLRAHSWYTLTDRAAYIATETFGRRSLKRYGIDEMTRLDLDDGQPGNVWFAHDFSTQLARRGPRMGFGSKARSAQTSVTPIGFRRIDDARQVYRLIADRREAARNGRDAEPRA